MLGDASAWMADWITSLEPDPVNTFSARTPIFAAIAGARSTSQLLG